MYSKMTCSMALCGRKYVCVCSIENMTIDKKRGDIKILLSNIKCGLVIYYITWNCHIFVVNVCYIENMCATLKCYLVIIFVIFSM